VNGCVLIRNGSINICNISFERVEQFTYFGIIQTDQNSIYEHIKSRLKSGSLCYYLVQKFLSSALLSKNLKIKVYRTIILSFCMGVKLGRSQ